MTTLITGGMGFIGLHTARAFLDAGEDVVLTYFQTWREPSFIRDEYHKRVQIEQVDVTDREGLMALGKKYTIDRIAPLAVPGLGALGPLEDLKTNVAGLTHMLEAALAWGSQRLTLASSVAVYAGLPAGPFVEDARLPVESGNPTETFKKAWEIREGRSPRWRQDVYMDISRIKADTGYEPRYTVETGVQDYVAWLQAGNVQ